MNADLTDITILLDRSGSMQATASDTIGGINQFLEDQRGAPGVAKVSLHLFDHEYVTAYSVRDVKTAPALTDKTYVPRGNTALLDAIGRTIVEKGRELAFLPEAERPGRVVIVIDTDGLENASREFDRQRVFEMITHQREKYAWEFVFLGANQDAIAGGMRMGIGAANSMTCAATPEGIRSKYAATSSNLCMMRSGLKGDMSYTAQQRQQQEDAGV